MAVTVDQVNSAKSFFDSMPFPVHIQWTKSPSVIELLKNQEKNGLELLGTPGKGWCSFFEAMRLRGVGSGLLETSARYERCLVVAPCTGQSCTAVSVFAVVIMSYYYLISLLRVLQSYNTVQCITKS